jgi:asparagine synthase (glutamine-hydrolysing)
MSALAGICHRDGSPVLQNLFDAIHSTLIDQGPDGGAVVVSGSVGMAFRSLQITPEPDSGKQQPLRRGDLILTWDGRLDNRDDLLLQLRQEVGANEPDEALVAAAWTRWNAGCLSQLIGDWALAVWNSREQSIYLARDFAGTCPLFYSDRRGRVLWSSELATFLRPEVEELQGALSLDESWIAGYLSGYGCDPGPTVYREVRMVMPGHVVEISRKGTTSKRFWAFDPENQVRYRYDHQYEEEFRFLFRQAVRRRLRAKRVVTAHLSGGLDSSSLVCMADLIVAENKTGDSRVETVSATFPSSPESDESEYISCIEKWRGQRGRHFPDRSYEIGSLRPYDTWPASPSFFDCYAVREKAICDAMAEYGSRIQMAGEGGDEMLGNAGEGVPNQQDLVQQCAFRKLWQELPQWSAIHRRSIWHSAGLLIGSYLPPGMQSRLETGTRKTLDLVNRSFQDRHDILTKYMGARDDYGYHIPSQRGRSEALAVVVRRISTVVFRRVGAVHATYPYLDRSLVAFLLSLPMDQIARPGQRRSLMRRSLADIVPAPVLWRKSKRSPDSSLHRGLLRNVEILMRLADNPVVSQLGFIDADRFSRSVRAVADGTYSATTLGLTVMLELWLRGRWRQWGSQLAPIETADMNFQDR